MGQEGRAQGEERRGKGESIAWTFAWNSKSSALLLGLGTYPRVQDGLDLRCSFCGSIMFLTTVSCHLSISRLKTALAKRTGRPEIELQGPEEGLGRRRSSRIMEETSGMEEEEEEETAAAVHGRRGRRDGEVRAQTKESGSWWELGDRLFLFLESDGYLFLGIHLFLQVDITTSSIPELERQIEKLSKVL